ncbi:MAG TPA: carboxypeptidase regulatory-like domain-containing protein [Candidatus Binatia bacterium]|nr:carboxypeptidase regulatory-like domain-containing protein [Candidatus Binatia bacterium]
MTARWPTTAAVLLLAHAAAAAGTGTLKGIVTRDGAGTPVVADAVVAIEGPSAPAAPSAPHAIVDQRNDTFIPHVVAVAVGTTVDFPNHDPRLHNVFSASPPKKIDLGMYDQGETRSVTFDAPGVVRLGCNVHPKMEAFVFVHPNPWVAVTDARGGYTIAGVPSGTYELRVWHEGFGERRMPVTVRDGAVQSLDVRLPAAH